MSIWIEYRHNSHLHLNNGYRRSIKKGNLYRAQFET